MIFSIPGERIRPSKRELVSPAKNHFSGNPANQELISSPLGPMDVEELLERV
jgi:hypothetical protein